MPNIIRTEKEATLQEMLDNYNKISKIGVMDFSDYYDCRMDGVKAEDLKQSPELDDYVNKLLTFQKEENAGMLEEEEKEVFKNLKNKLQSEANETGIHKLLQFKLMDALLNADGNLDSKHLETAADCQKLYADITSFQIIEANAKKNAMQDDGSFNKSPKKIAEEILKKEEEKKKTPLTQICIGMLNDFEKYSDILEAPALMPYQTFVDEKLKAKKREEEAVMKVMTPEEKEKLRLNQEIAEKRAEREKLMKQLDKTSMLFRDDYQKARKNGIDLTVPNEQDSESRVFMETSVIEKLQTEEEAELNDTFNVVTDHFVKGVDALKATDKGKTSDEFRKMIEGLTMLRNHEDTMKNLGKDTNSRHLALVDTIAQVYEDVNKYVAKREKDSFVSRRLGQGGTRYKQAKAIRDLLETYYDAAVDLERHRTKAVLLGRMQKKEVLQEEINKTEKEIYDLTELRDGKQKRENLKRTGDVREKSASTRQRLENGFKDLNNSAESEKKQIAGQKEIVNKKNSQPVKSVASEKSNPEMAVKGKIK